MVPIEQWIMPSLSFSTATLNASVNGLTPFLNHNLWQLTHSYILPSLMESLKHFPLPSSLLILFRLVLACFSRISF